MNIDQRILALSEQRMNAWEQGKALLEETSGRAMTAEERQTYDRINDEINALEFEITELRRGAIRETEAAQLREMTVSAIGEIGEQRIAKQEMDHFRAWLQAPKGSDLRSAEFEIDIQRAIRERQLLRQGASAEEIRAMAWDATSGSLVVPTTMARSLYEYLEASIAGFRIGATVLNTSTGENMQLPKLNAHAVGTQINGQGSVFAGTDPTFGRVDLNVYKYGDIVKISSELVTDAAFNIESWLGGDLGYALGRVIDTDLIVGTGTGEPTGMTVLAGAGTNAPVKTGGSLIAPTVENYIDTQYTVNDMYREKGKWLLKDSVAGTIRKLRDGAGGTVGAFLWQPSLTRGVIDGAPDTFLGSPVYTDPNCAAAGSNAKLATYGAFDEYVIRTVGNPVIERDDSVYFATDESAFRGKWRVGGNHRDVSALAQLVQNV